MKVLILGAAATVLWSGGAFADTDCSGMGSRSFFVDAQYDSILECAEANPDRLLATDQRGYNFLMNLVTSEVEPVLVSDVLSLLDEERATALLEAKDRQGRGIAHIAAAEASNPGMIVTLSSMGAYTSEEYNVGDGWLAGGTTPLHLAATRPDGAMFVATLLALGAVGLGDRNDKSAADLAWNGEPANIDGAILLLEKGEWSEIFEFEPEEYPRPKELMCGKLVSPEFWQADLKMLELATDDQSELLVDRVVHCLQSPSQFDAVDRNGNTILHLAAQYAHDPWIVDVILVKAPDSSALLSRRNLGDRTALHLAAEHSQSPWLMARLLAWGADPNARSHEVKTLVGKMLVGKNRGLTALHLAASRKDDLREEFLTILLAHGADTMLQDPPGADARSGSRTALHRAVLDPDPYVLLLLMEAQSAQENLAAMVVRAMFGKALKQIKDDDGRTALHIAAGKDGDLDTIVHLYAYGFSLDEPDTEGVTPLMYAARYLTDPDLFLGMLELSEKPCGKAKNGTTVAASLSSNEHLNKVDPSGMETSLLAELMKRC